MAVSVVDEAVGDLSLSATPMIKHSMFMDLTGRGGFQQSYGPPATVLGKPLNSLFRHPTVLILFRDGLFYSRL